MRSIMRHLQCILMSGEIHLFTFSNFLLIFADFSHAKFRIRLSCAVKTVALEFEWVAPKIQSN